MHRTERLRADWEAPAFRDTLGRLEAVARLEAGRLADDPDDEHALAVLQLAERVLRDLTLMLAVADDGRTIHTRSWPAWMDAA